MPKKALDINDRIKELVVALINISVSEKQRFLQALPHLTFAQKQKVLEKLIHHKSLQDKLFRIANDAQNIDLETKVKALERQSIFEGIHEKEALEAEKIDLDAILKEIS